VERRKDVGLERNTWRETGLMGAAADRATAISTVRSTAKALSGKDRGRWWREAVCGSRAARRGRHRSGAAARRIAQRVAKRVARQHISLSRIYMIIND
jgi:hypothetical protein